MIDVAPYGVQALAAAAVLAAAMLVIPFLVLGIEELVGWWGNRHPRHAA